MNDWQPVSDPPPLGVPVLTKIVNGDGSTCREGVTLLLTANGLWARTTGETVLWQPTHWAEKS